MVRALPGDPLDTLVAETGTSIPREVIRHEMGLDRAFFPALAEDTVRLAHGDLGKSLFSKEPITPLILRRFKNTLILALTSLAISLALSLWIGLKAAQNPGTLADRFCTGFGAFTAALPSPWIGPVLIVVFAVWIPLFPLGENVCLPAITLALSLSGMWARLIRNRVRDSLLLGSSQAARARGVPEWLVLLKYGLAPVSGTLVGYLGVQFGDLLAGTFVIEVIFNWRGMGSLWVNAVLRRDYPVIEAATFVAAASILLGILWGDACKNLIQKKESRVL